MEANSGDWVVGKLIPDPMLINGRKFILSLYLLVRSFQPMDAFLYNRSSGRLASKDYTTAAESLSDEEVHLPFESYAAEVRIPILNKCSISITVLILATLT